MTYQELVKILISEKPYQGLKENEKAVFKLLPELEACKGFEQNNNWHIYDVYEHILHVVENVESNVILRLAALFHDLGKPLSYKQDENGIGHFYNHWSFSLKIFKKYKDEFLLSEEEKNIISNLIFYHDINISKLSKEELEELLKELGIENIPYLFSFKKADLLAQNPIYHKQLEIYPEQQQSILKIKIK